MNIALTVLQQIVIMLLLGGIGYLMFRTGKITLEGSKTLGNLMINLSIPALIINGFLTERTEARVQGLLLSALLSAAILLISVMVSTFLLRKDPVAVFAGAMGNPGFFGIPVITACIGSAASFYMAFFVAFLNLTQWSWGVSLLKGEKTGFGIKKLMTAPFVIAILIGFACFMTGIKLPEVAEKTVSYLAGLTTPFGMFTVGVYFAQVDLKKSICKLSLYKVILVKMLLIPCIMLFALMPLPERFYELKFALLLASATPTGSNIAVYAQLHDRDYPYAVETVIFTTLISVVTLPVVVQAAALLWN